MIAAHRRATIGYLALALLLGGASAGGVTANLVLQLLGAALIAWSLPLPAPRLDRRARWLAGAVLVLAAVQFVPLPFDLWRRLPGRAAIAADLVLAGAAPPWVMLSLSPWHSLASLCGAIPALALVAALRVQPPDLAPAPVPALARTIILVAIASALLGIVQQARRTGYVYAITNFGAAPGLFANANHQANLLLTAAILTCTDLAGGVRTAGRLRGATFLGAAALPLFVVGIILNRSTAVALMAPLAAIGVVASTAPRRLPGRSAAGALVAAAAAGIVLLAGGWITSDLLSAGVVPGIDRRTFLTNGIAALRAFAPTGSGLGTFRQIYPLFEQPALVGPTYVNHAHDDGLELLIETGLFGLAALAALLAWAAPQARSAWANGDGWARAATIILAVEAVHSLADYPLRTAALGAVAAVAAAMLSARRPHSADAQPADAPPVEPSAPTSRGMA